jgi:hypothetical protein
VKIGTKDKSQGIWPFGPNLELGSVNSIYIFTSDGSVCLLSMYRIQVGASCAEISRAQVLLGC